MFPQSYDQNFSDYPKETTIHGVKYLGNRNRPLADRIFWMIIFTLSISSLGYFVYKICRTWIENPVMITDQQKPIYVFEIPFPAVTICPQIKIKADKFDFENLNDDVKQLENITDFESSEIGKKWLMASQICRREFKNYIKPKMGVEKFLEMVEFFEMPRDWINTLHDISPNFNEVFEACEMSSFDMDGAVAQSLDIPSTKNCKRLFSTIITNEGICFTFNGLRDILQMDSLQTDFPYHNIKQKQNGWDPENGYTKGFAYPYKASKLKFILKANFSDVTPLCLPADIGYSITLNSPTTYPSTYDNFIPLAYGKDYKIAAIPKTIKTNEDLRSFSPEVRNCFFNDERKLKFYTYYSKENCELECYLNFTKSYYYGAAFSSPRDSNTTNSMFPNNNYGWELPALTLLYQEHLNTFEPELDFPNMAGEFYCNCLPECNALRYEYKILKINDDFSLKTSGGATEMNKSSLIGTTVEIIFNEPSFTGQKRVRMYTFENVLSDFGGLLGLFMGGSVLSLFELFYFLTIRNCFKLKSENLQI